MKAKMLFSMINQVVVGSWVDSLVDTKYVEPYRGAYVQFRQVYFQHFYTDSSSVTGLRTKRFSSCMLNLWNNVKSGTAAWIPYAKERTSSYGLSYDPLFFRTVGV